MGNQYTAQRDTIANLRQRIRDLEIDNERLRQSTQAGGEISSEFNGGQVSIAVGESVIERIDITKLVYNDVAKMGIDCSSPDEAQSCIDAFDRCTEFYQAQLALMRVAWPEDDYWTKEA